MVFVPVSRYVKLALLPSFGFGLRQLHRITIITEAYSLPSTGILFWSYGIPISPDYLQPHTSGMLCERVCTEPGLIIFGVYLYTILSTCWHILHPKLIRRWDYNILPLFWYVIMILPEVSSQNFLACLVFYSLARMVLAAWQQNAWCSELRELCLSSFQLCIYDFIHN